MDFIYELSAWKEFRRVVFKDACKKSFQGLCFGVMVSSTVYFSGFKHRSACNGAGMDIIGVRMEFGLYSST